jgi:hypothetical protein
MVVRCSRDIEDNAGTRLKERGKIGTVKTGRGFTTTKPGKLNQGWEKNTEGINIAKKLNNIKELLSKI